MRVSATYARQNLASLLKRVVDGGEIEIERHGCVLARLVPPGDATESIEASDVFPAPRAMGGSSRIERLFHQRALRRFHQAAPVAQKALARLRGLGIQVRVIGSLARGTFKQTSDIDFLVEDAHSISDLEIERVIRKELGEFPFDVVYLDRITKNARETILGEFG